ncbi:MAG TPA: thioredoxin domain-containing protein [Polyangiales bacterium]|nr:thioredoxin domain-containing protein [Polyangiales bacterium]
MNKGSAIVAIIIAAVAGFVVGQISAKKGAGIAEIADASKEHGDSAAGAVAGVTEDEPVERLKVPVTDAQPSKGPSDAPVTIVAFSDFECPFCGRVNPTIEQLEKDYGKKIRVIWRNQPLPFHQNALPAAQAAMEAFSQGKSEKFWAMHDKLFANRAALTRPDLEKYAGEIGLDVAKFKTALDTNKHDAEIKADQELAGNVGARGTPSFFINGRNLRGAQPVEKFKEIIDDELKRVDKLKAKNVPAKAVYATLMAGAKDKVEAPAAQPQQAQPDDTTVYKVPVTSNDPVKGPNDALVTVVIFSDYQCPFCSRVEPTLAALSQKYGNDVRFVWKDNPLPFHNDATPAAIVAREAYAEGKDKKFWEAHDLLFQNQRALGRADLEGYAKQLGLNANKVKAALDANPYKDKIEADKTLAASLGASGTPSFFVNGRSLRGAQPQPAFEKLIDEELAKAKAKVGGGVAKAKLYEEIIKNGATAPAAPKGQPAAQAEPDANKIYQIAEVKDAPSKGGKNAKVVIQEFSDFQCPFCSRVGPTIKQITDEYKDKVKIVWRNYPLPFHQDAGPAAQAAREVFEQAGSEKFWAYHDLLFANQRALSRADLEKYATDLGGINLAKFKAALDNKTHEARVKEDMDAVDKAGARIGTPSFFINGKLLQGAQPFEAFKAAIDEALKAK